MRINARPAKTIVITRDIVIQNAKTHMQRAAGGDDMTCLEHFIENGLEFIDGHTYKEWIDAMNKDINREHSNISIEQLWEICQYIRYTYLPCHIQDYCYRENKAGKCYMMED